METQRQEREEALISARAELKDLDLEEVDLESKIRAANETIKLRQSQEDKVKEEMTNLKAGEKQYFLQTWYEKVVINSI